MIVAIPTTHREPFYIRNVLEVDRRGTSTNTLPDQIPAPDIVLTPSTAFSWLVAGGKCVYYTGGRARLLKDDGHLAAWI